MENSNQTNLVTSFQGRKIDHSLGICFGRGIKGTFSFFLVIILILKLVGVQDFGFQNMA